MGLDVDTPDPPSLSDPQDVGDYDAVEETDERVGDDYRREELAGALEDGAWKRAFEEWSDHTLLTAEEYELVVALGLVEELDFYWNPASEDVGYRVPAVPSHRELPSPYDERFEEGDLDGVEEELDGLARTVTEVLETQYVRLDETDEFGFFSEESGEEGP